MEAQHEFLDQVEGLAECFVQSLPFSVFLFLLLLPFDASCSVARSLLSPSHAADFCPLPVGMSCLEEMYN